MLIVDDDPSQSRLLRRPLEQAGYSVLEAQSGKECLDLLTQHHPELMILDVILGEENGVELARRIKADTQYDDVFILLVSGSKVSSTDQAFGLQAGVEGYLTRPVDSQELVARVDSLARTRLAEAELKRSEALWRAMFSASSDPMLVLDDQALVTYANPVSCELYGMSRTDLVGSSLMNLLPRSEHEFMSSRIRDAVAGTPQIFESEHIAGGGRAAHVEVTLSAFSFQDDVRLLAVIRDLFVRQEHERERLTLMHDVVFERERLNNIISSVPGVVWEAWGGPEGSEHTLNYVSDYVEQMLGYSISEWNSDPAFALNIVHADDRERVREELRRAYMQADPGHQLSSQYRWRKKDGNYIWVEALSRVVLDQHRKAVGMRGVTVDITRRKEAEENLKYQVDYNRAITQSMVEGLIVYDENSCIVFMNRAAGDLLGYSVDELHGKGLHGVLHGAETDHSERSCSLDLPLRESRALVNLEEKFVRKDGSAFPTLCSTAPLFTRSNVTGGVLVFRDISDLKLKEAEIRRLNTDLERRVTQRTAQLQETNEQLELT
ncbi:MAG TPA: PAS domain S-box protein, partial [Candidatus Kapabacteria bacterium]|nr:PAS domain S-box protein [Candidatus Kapabacteria bacterium]